MESSLLYFYSGAATIVLCVIAYFYLLQLPLSQEVLPFLKGKILSEITTDDSSNIRSVDHNQNLDDSGSKGMEMKETSKLMEASLEEGAQRRYRSGSVTSASSMGTPVSIVDRLFVLNSPSKM